MDVSRRDILKGGAVLAAGLVATAGISTLGACANNEGAQGATPPETWDGEHDVVVVGMGFAGLAAAITAKDEDLGDIIVLEAAPETECGGNSRTSGGMLFTLKSAQSAYAYQVDLNGVYTVEDDYMKPWSEMVSENYEWLGDHLGFDMVDTGRVAEFPDAACAEDVTVYRPAEGTGNAYLWTFLKETAEELGAEFAFDARAIKLITNADNEVIGVSLEDGRKLKARKGVILACGGFEGNPEMQRNYLMPGYARIYPKGTPYNLGDGIKMSQEVGADLWHMNNYAGYGIGTQVSAKNPDLVGAFHRKTHDFIFVGESAKRFMYEERGQFLKHGKWLDPSGHYVPGPSFTPAWMIFGQKYFEADLASTGMIADGTGWAGLVMGIPGIEGETNAGALQAGLIKRGETISELAQQIGLDGVVLQETVDMYNGYAGNNDDPEFFRGQLTTDVSAAGKSIEEFNLESIEGPYYAIELRPIVLNTQGGPKRNWNCEVVKPSGEIIPRLYSAGELGAIYSNEYNAGGNVAECLATGRTSMRNCTALEAWDAKS